MGLWARFVLVTSALLFCRFGTLLTRLVKRTSVDEFSRSCCGFNNSELEVVVEMSLLHFRCKERRRTLRVALTVPLTIHGKTDSGEKFSAQTHSQSVNRHGALFQLEEIVLVGQTLILMK